MTLTSRIEALRRRVDRDPAPLSFAQLAEEYRRRGDHEDAVRVATAGLAHHPDSLSARVILGRALLHLGHVEAARRQLEFVVANAPDHLVAVRTLGGIDTRQPAAPEPLSPRITVVDSASVPDPLSQFAMEDHLTGLGTNDSSGTAGAPVAGEAALPALEQWLAAIVADRAART